MSVSVEDAGLQWPELTPEEAVELTSFLYFIEYLGQPGVPANGRALYRSKGCAACHGGTDQRGDRGPDLTDLRRFASPIYIAQAIWNHGPEMLDTMRAAGMRRPTFAEGDLADLSAFLRQAMAAGPQERVLVAPGNPNRGRDLFAEKGCAGCHGTGGSGGAGGPDLTEAELHRSAEAIAGMMWNHAPKMREAIRARGLVWPTLSTEELADLVAFLYFLPFADERGDAGRGAEVFSARGCGECHGSVEPSAHAGPELVGTQAAASPAAFVAAIWNHAPVMKEAILGEGRPWPALSGDDMRDLLAFIQKHD
jgi:mono/diheme cytochrome c family protein